MEVKLGRTKKNLGLYLKKSRMKLTDRNCPDFYKDHPAMNLQGINQFKLEMLGKPKRSSYKSFKKAYIIYGRDLFHT